VDGRVVPGDVVSTAHQAPRILASEFSLASLYIDAVKDVAVCQTDRLANAPFDVKNKMEATVMLQLHRTRSILGGLVVNKLVSGTQHRWFELAMLGPKPSDFLGEKIHSMPSFGGEVNPPVPCRRFGACKRPLRLTWKSESQVKLTG
jgi:hypothetical protein